MHSLYLTISLVVLSQSAIFIRFAHAHAAAIGFWRLVIALPVLGLVLFGKGRGRELRVLSRTQWLQLALCGTVLFLHFYTWFLSVQKTSVANSMIFFSSNPIYTALGAWLFFQEKIERRHVVSLVLCLAGLYFLVRENLLFHPGHLEGDLLALTCAILFSLYVLVSKNLRKNLHNLPFSFVTYSVCCVWFFLLMLGLGLPFSGYDSSTWLSFSALAIGSTLLGHSLFTHCLQYFNVNLMSVSTLSEPALTMVSAYFLFREPITGDAIVGFILVALGILALYGPYLISLVRKPCA